MPWSSITAGHREALLASVRPLVRPPVDASDIVQEACVRAIPAIEAGRVENVQAFLYGVARNVAAEAMRQQFRWSRWLVHHPAAEQIADDAPSAEAHLSGKDELDRLRAVMEELPPRCREVFVLRNVEMLEKKQIAIRLGIDVKQVEKQLRHGLMLCTRMLDEQGCK